MKILLYLLLVLLLSACSNNQTAIDKKQINTDAFQLPDSLFPFKDIQSSLIENMFWYDEKTDKLFADSTMRIPIIYLDSAQKMKLIIPIMAKEGKIDPGYVIQYMRAIFVSKQKNIGSLTPIVVRVSGDDYNELFYVLLDRTFNPVSYFSLSGGQETGPDDQTDSTIDLQAVTNSYIKGNEIISYSLKQLVKIDSLKEYSVFDSVSYINKILPSGQIITTRLDSVRYETKPKFK